MALWAKWTGEGLTASIIPDMSGNGRDLDNYGLTAISDSLGYNNIALSCDGSSYAILPSSSMPAIYTICIRYYTDETTNQYIIASGTNANLSLRVNLTDYSYQSVAGKLNVTTANFLSTEHFSLMQYDEVTDVVSDYLDDAVTAKYSGGPHTGLTAVDVRFGGDPNVPAAMLIGKIADIAIYDTILTETERVNWSLYSALEAPSQIPGLEGSCTFPLLEVSGESDFSAVVGSVQLPSLNASGDIVIQPIGDVTLPSFVAGGEIALGSVLNAVTLLPVPISIGVITTGSYSNCVIILPCSKCSGTLTSSQLLLGDVECKALSAHGLAISGSFSNINNSIMPTMQVNAKANCNVEEILRF